MDMWRLLWACGVVWSNVVTHAAKDEDCPSDCFCNPLSNIVHCTRKGFTRIPSRIPDGTLQLNLNGNILDTTLIQRRNFSSFVDLEHLYLSECGIERIEVGAFTDLQKLTWLDLSSNRIRVLEDYTFRGLSLQQLFLNGNRNINIKRNAFAEFSTSGLRVHECSLSKLDLHVFENLKDSLTNLWLNENELEKVDKRFLSIFNRLDHIKLGSNPFHCNCEILWLKEFYDRNGDKFDSSEAGTPSCLSPQKLKSKLFSQISLFDFQCEAPSFRNIDAVFKGDNGMLRCTASGDPAPTLYWIQPSGQSNLYRPSNNDSVRYNEAVLNISTQTTHKHDLSGSYFCFARNDAGNMTLTFNLTWPTAQQEPTINIASPPQLQTLSPPPDGVPTSRHKKRPHHRLSSTESPRTTARGPSYMEGEERETDIYIPDIEEKPKFKTKESTTLSTSSKDTQYTADKISTDHLYTLAELLGAIFGTFACTLLLCCIIIPLYFRRRWKNNNSPHHSHHSVVSKPSLQETMYLNGSGSGSGRSGPPQLPPRPGEHPYSYFDPSVSLMSHKR